MGAICHITPVLNNILDLCRFDLMYLICHPPPPNKISQDAFRHITLQPFNQSASSRSSHNKNHLLPKRSTMLKSIYCFKFDIKRSGRWSPRFPVHITPKQNTHLCTPLGLCSTSFSMYCQAGEGVQEWNGASVYSCT